MKTWLTRRHRPFLIICLLITSAITLINYWPFMVGQKLFYHDSLVGITTMGMFYDRFLSADSWLWSSSLNSGHPLWMATEATPYWDPVAFIIYGAAAALNANWLIPYQITVFVWLLLFALGGGACARQITRNPWAGLLAFFLLYGGPAADMIPAQSWGFILPFRYFPFVLYAYICLRRTVNLRNSLFFTTAMAFSLAGYNSAYAFFQLIIVFGTDLLISRREFIRWIPKICQLRHVVFLLIPFLAALPTMVFLYNTQDFVIIPRIHLAGLAYFLDIQLILTQLLFFMSDNYFILGAQFSYHGSVFFGHLALPLLIHGAQRSIRSIFSRARPSGEAWSDQTGPPITLISFIITMAVACGGLGVESYVRTEGTLFGVRSYGFLLAGLVLMIVLLIAYGLSEILSGRFQPLDIAICTVVFGLGAGIFLWISNLGKFDGLAWLLMIGAFGALLLMILLLRSKAPNIRWFIVGIIMLVLIENVLYVNRTLLSYLDIESINNGNLTRGEVISKTPKLRTEIERFSELRNANFDYKEYLPYVFLAPVVYKTPYAFIQSTYDDQLTESITHFFRLRNYAGLLTDDIDARQRRQILGITRPILELVPRRVVREDVAVSSFLLKPKTEVDQAAEASAKSSGRTFDATLGTTDIAEFAGDRILVDVDARVNVVLIYRDNYAPGWSVRVNGRAASLLVVDRVNKAVALSAGRHTVEFIYRPWLYLGAFTLRVVALLVAGAACASLAIGRWRHIAAS